MAAKQPPSRSEFVTAAIAYVDEHGLAALTLRSLGDALGVNHTSLYRHFRDKDELLIAVIDRVLGEVMTEAASKSRSPRERLLHLLRRTRATFDLHPQLAAAVITARGDVPRGHGFTAAVVAELEALGLGGDDVPVCYQMLEDFVLGSTIYDLAQAPNHLETRRVRHRLFGHPLFDEISRTTADIASLNDAAFERGLTTLVDGCIPASARTRRSASNA